MGVRSIIFVFLLVLFQLPGRAQTDSFELDSSKFQKGLLPVLDTIGKDDQAYRLKMIELLRNGALQQEVDSIRNVIWEVDRINLVKVEKILAEYGWLGPQDVGVEGSQALFLVIQHADLATQRRFLPMIRAAEKEGKTLSSNLALLEDRIAMREGRRQLYGSQGFTDKMTGQKYVYPVVDPDQLDERRSSMGLPPMESYVLGWDLKAYKEKLLEIERIVREQNIH